MRDVVDCQNPRSLARGGPPRSSPADREEEGFQIGLKSDGDFARSGVELEVDVVCLGFVLFLLPPSCFLLPPTSCLLPSSPPLNIHSSASATPLTQYSFYPSSPPEAPQPTSCRGELSTKNGRMRIGESTSSQHSESLWGRSFSF